MDFVLWWCTGCRRCWHKCTATIVETQLDDVWWIDRGRLVRWLLRLVCWLLRLVHYTRNASSKELW